MDRKAKGKILSTSNPQTPQPLMTLNNKISDNQPKIEDMKFSELKQLAKERGL